MKSTIHPKTYEAKVTCSCGNTFTTTSTKQEIRVEVCSKCHPFYTGEHRFVDTKGRVENFQKKQQAAQAIKQTISARKQKKADKGEHQTKSLRELLGEM